MHSIGSLAAGAHHHAPTRACRSRKSRDKTQSRFEEKSKQSGLSIGAGAGAGMGQDSGSASSVTQAAISGIAGNQDARTGDAETGIAPIFDQERVKAEVSAQVAITAAFGQQASKAVGDYATRQLQQASGLREQASAEPDAARRAELIAQADLLESNWGDNGTLRLLAHTTIGALTGGAAGAAGAAAGTISAPLVANALNEAGVQGPLADLITAAASTAVGAGVGGAAGATAAYNEVQNNFLTHAEASRRLKLQSELLACSDAACRQDKQTEIDRLNRLDLWRDQQIDQACNSPISAACQSWTAAIQVASKSYEGQFGNLVDKAERASVQNQAFKYQQAVNNPFMHGVGKGLLKLTPPGLLVGAAGGVAMTVQAIAENGLSQTLIDGVNAIAGLPADLKARLNSPDPTVRGEAVVDVISLGFGTAAATAAGTKIALTTFQKAQVAKAVAEAEAKAVALAKIENNVRVDDGQQYDQFRNASNDGWDWQKHAPNSGAVPGTLQTIKLDVGMSLDRYGSRYGEFMSPAATPLEQRALPPGKAADQYERYMVVKPLNVDQEQIAPAFGQVGGGVQLRARIAEVPGDYASIEQLIQHGYLKVKP